MMVSDGFFRACWQKVAWVFYNIPAKTWEACSALTPHLSPKTAMASRSCFFSMLRLCWLLANCLREKKTNTAWMLNNLNPLTCQQFGSQLHLVVSKNGCALGTPTWMHYMSVVPWSKHNSIIDDCQCGSTLFLDLSHHKGNPIKSSTSNKTASHREAP